MYCLLSTYEWLQVLVFVYDSISALSCSFKCSYLLNALLMLLVVLMFLLNALLVLFSYLKLSCLLNSLSVLLCCFIMQMCIKNIISAFRYFKCFCFFKMPY